MAGFEHVPRGSITLKAAASTRRRGQSLSLSGATSPAAARGHYKVYVKRPGSSVWKAWSPLRTLSGRGTWSWKTAINRSRYPKRGNSYWKVTLWAGAGWSGAQSRSVKVVIR